MTVVTVDTSELDRWGRALARAGIEITIVNEKVLTEAAKELKTRATNMAPVLTGALARSIRITAGKEWRRVGSPLKQGFFQEFGTSRHPPQPWLFPNADHAATKMERELGVAGTKVLLR
jgi:hypothetical protein